MLENPDVFCAWVYALGQGKVRVADAMLHLWRKANDDLPRGYKDHMEAELSHGELLIRSVSEARSRWTQNPVYSRIEGALVRAVESYVMALIGFAERQTHQVDAQYGTAALSLGSRVFRHFSELIQDADRPDIADALSCSVKSEARHARAAQAMLLMLPCEARGIYRGVRAFEEMLFERMVGNLSRNLITPDAPGHSRFDDQSRVGPAQALAS